MEDVCILFQHGNAWDGVPARQGYRMEALAKHIPIVYLEDSEDRKWHVSYHAPIPNVTVVRGLIPIALKLRQRGWEFVNHALFRWHLRWLKKQYRRVIIWDAENWLRPHRFLSHDALIFHYIDPCFSENPNDIADFELR